MYCCILQCCLVAVETATSHDSSMRQPGLNDLDVCCVHQPPFGFPLNGGPGSGCPGSHSSSSPSFSKLCSCSFSQRHGPLILITSTSWLPYQRGPLFWEANSSLWLPIKTGKCLLTLNTVRSKRIISNLKYDLHPQANELRGEV